MKDLSKIDYCLLDRPEILSRIFYPRREDASLRSSSVSAQDVLIPVDKGVEIGGCFHTGEKKASNVLFFHGNGEIAADYDDLGPAFNRIGINFLAVDYRGYGRSTGQSTVTAMMRDCHTIFEFVTHWLNKAGNVGPLLVMGRSLGSAPALELAANYQDRLDGLIIESGFAHASPLLEVLGISIRDLGFREIIGFRNIDKISSFLKPTLIIHAEHDIIIPFADAETLYNSSRACRRTLLKIQGAGHNSIFSYGFNEYMTALRNLLDTVKAERGRSELRECPHVSNQKHIS